MPSRHDWKPDEIFLLMSLVVFVRLVEMDCPGWSRFLMNFAKDKVPEKI